MKTTESGKIETGFGKVYYERAGKGEKLIFLHAGFVDGRMWDGQWEAFSQHYEVFRYDLIGFGQSDPAQGRLARRDELKAFMDGLGIERATLVGCSLSGETVLDFALEHPERVAAQVLVSMVPSGFEFQGEPPADLMAMVSAMMAGDLEQASEYQLRLWVDGPFRAPEQVDSAVREQARQMNRICLENGTYFKVEADPMNPLDPAAVGRLKEISAPTLIIVGELDNPEILRAGRYMAAEISGARLITMANCAHLPNMEEPGLFNKNILP